MENTDSVSRKRQKKPKIIKNISLKKHIVVYLSPTLKIQKINELGIHYFKCHSKKWEGKSLLALLKEHPDIITKRVKNQLQIHFPSFNTEKCIRTTHNKQNSIAIYWDIVRISLTKKQHKKLALIGYLLTFHQEGHYKTHTTHPPLFNHLPAYYFWKDAEHNYIWCTHAYSILHQFPHTSEIQGKTDADLYPEKTAKLMKNIEKEALEKRRSVQDRDIICYLNGQQQHFKLTVIPIRYTYIKPAKTLLLGQLLRQHRQHVDSLTKIMETNLEKGYATAPISSEENDALNQAKFNFLAAMSHNLRTPLNSIIVSSQLLQAMPHSEEQAEFITATLESSQKLLCIIEDVLNFSKIETGALDLNMDCFDLRKTIEDIIGLESHKALNKGLDLILCYNELIPRHIISDAFYIKRILINLLENAIKFTEKGHILIKVEGIQHAKYKANISILVQDTGIGIPQDQLENIFEHFTLIEPAYKSADLSPGLGLSVVQALVKKLEGTISVKSNTGKGSSFTIHLPVNLQHTVTRYSTFYRHYTNHRLLVIDDNALRGEIILDQTGFNEGKLIKSNQAIEEIDRSRKNHAPYQIILVDDDIQSIDPLELAKYIRRQPEFKTTMLIYLSKPGPFSKINKAKLAGFFRQIYKPIKPSELINTLGNGWSHWIVKTKNHESLFKTFEPILFIISKEKIVQQIMTVIYQTAYCKIETSHDYHINDTIKEGNYDAMFIDMDSMEQETLSLIKAIREHEDHTNPVPLIVITTHLSLRQEKKLKELGICHFINKPLDHTEAKQTLLDSLFPPLSFT